MKSVVSVSIGSSVRDHEASLELLGEQFSICRRGTDGDTAKAMSILHQLDGQVDAIGLGGLDIYLRCGKDKYALRDGKMMMDSVKKTPVVDGSGLKDTLERVTIKMLEADGRIPIKGRKVLLVCAMDRFGMAEAMISAGANIIFGDMIFAMGIDKPLHSLHQLSGYVKRLLPHLSQLPMSMLYPTGKKQMAIEPSELTDPYYREAEIIAGDFLYIRRHMPNRLDGKVIITNTVTAADVEELRRRGVAWLVTTTPELQGRSFGTNVMEALFISILGKKWDDVVPEDYLALIEQLGFKPRIEKLQ
ncbi:quinate 5-dehydrogenase [bacterium]|nr:quinate 5-dehydrogenase [bacterium]